MAKALANANIYRNTAETKSRAVLANMSSNGNKALLLARMFTIGGLRFS
jgi:hypothetical protein